MKTMINLATMIATTAIISSPATMGTTMIHCGIDSGRVAHPVSKGEGRGGEGRGGGIIMRMLTSESILLVVEYTMGRSLSWYL